MGQELTWVLIAVVGVLLLWLACWAIYLTFLGALWLLQWALEHGFIGFAVYVVIWVVAFPVMLVTSFVIGLLGWRVAKRDGLRD